MCCRCFKVCSPSSFPTMLSNMIRSLNLYVSQQQTTGTPAPFDIIATVALPALENIAPFDNMAAAPRSVSETPDRTEPIEDSRTYVHGMSTARRDLSRFFPSCIGLESTIMTEKRLPCSFAAIKTPSTSDDLFEQKSLAWYFARAWRSMLTFRKSE